MKNKRLIKILTLGITSMFLGGAVLTASAASSKEPLKLSRNEAVKLAINNSNDIKRVDTGIDTLQRKFKKLKDLSDEVKKLQDGFEDYKKAYKKINSDEFKQGSKAITDAVKGYGEAENTIKDLNEKLIMLKKIPSDKLTDEQKGLISKIEAGIKKAEGAKKYIEGQLKAKNMTIESARAKYKEMEAALLKFNAAKAIFIKANLADKKSGAPKSLTSEEEYEMFIRPQEVPWYSVQCLIEKAVKQREIAKNIADVSVNEAYTKILYGEDGYELKGKLYNRMTKGYNDLVKSYNVGASPKIQVDLTKLSLDETKLEVDSLKRTIENGKIQFKSALGVDPTGDIQLKDKINKNLREVKDFGSYLNQAFKNRYEIFSAEVDVREHDRNFEKIKDYFCDDDYRWINEEHRLDEAKIALSEAKRNVKIDIENRYLDVKQKKRQIDLNSQNLKKAKTQLKAAKISYEAGIKPISLIWDAELGLSKAEMDYDSSIRDYNIAIYKLDKATYVGIDMENINAFKKEVKRKIMEMRGGAKF